MLLVDETQQQIKRIKGEARGRITKVDLSNLRNLDFPTDDTQSTISKKLETFSKEASEQRVERRKAKVQLSIALLQEASSGKSKALNII